MGRKLLLVGLWFPLSAALLISLLVNLVVLGESHKAAVAHAAQPLADAPPLYDLRINTNIAAGQTAQVLSAIVTAGDGRPYLLEAFLTAHTSPLAPYAAALVTESDANSIDYRLVAAIAMCESNLGKRIPGGSYNAWGISIESGETSGATFKGWAQAIAWVSRYVRDEYTLKGLGDLRSMGAKWAPPSVNTGYSWTSCVDSFMKAIENSP